MGRSTTKVLKLCSQVLGLAGGKEGRKGGQAGLKQMSKQTTAKIKNNKNKDKKKEKNIRQDGWASCSPSSLATLGGPHLFRPPTFQAMLSHHILGKTRKYHKLIQRLGRSDGAQTAPLQALHLVSPPLQLRSPMAVSMVTS